MWRLDLNEAGNIIFRDGIFLCASKSIRVGKAAPNESGACALNAGLKLGKLEGHGVAFLCFNGGVYKSNTCRR